MQDTHHVKMRILPNGDDGQKVVLPRRLGEMMNMAARAKGPKHPDLDFILLGLIRIHPDISGYQLRAAINGATGYFFHAHLSQIYPSLRRLNDEGLVSFTEVSRDGKPTIKLYSITDEGAALLDAWLVRPYVFEMTRANSDRYFMKLILMGHLSHEEVEGYIDSGIEALSAQRRIARGNSLEEEFTFIEEVEPCEHARYRVLWSSELSFVGSELEARIDWLKRLKNDLSCVEA